ncbi:MAG: hypothetical protein JWQ23_2180 [Herminiimonas sp.]|nr:hypothetical protein [Herminiimonas sp.]
MQKRLAAVKFSTLQRGPALHLLIPLGAGVELAADLCVTLQGRPRIDCTGSIHYTMSVFRCARVVDNRMAAAQVKSRIRMH